MLNDYGLNNNQIRNKLRTIRARRLKDNKALEGRDGFGIMHPDLEAKFQSLNEVQQNRKAVRLATLGPPTEETRVRA